MSTASESDSNHGGALGQLPREIRDTIYRLLVKSRYVSCDHEYTRGPYTRPDLSILRVSKLISHEAMETMFSDSVFLFDLNIYKREDDYVDRMFSQMRRFSPMMKTIEISIDCYSLERAEWILIQFPPTRDRSAKAEYAKNLRARLDATMGLFEGVSIERRSLHIRFRRCCPNLLRTTHFTTICERLKALVGFRTVTIEVIPEEKNYLRGDAEETRLTRELVACITQTLKQELQPAFGPAISALNFSADTQPTTGHAFGDDGDIAPVGFLKFHPVKHSVKERAIRND